MGAPAGSGPLIVLVGATNRPAELDDGVRRRLAKQVGGRVALEREWKGRSVLDLHVFNQSPSHARTRTSPSPFASCTFHCRAPRPVLR